MTKRSFRFGTGKVFIDPHLTVTLLVPSSVRHFGRRRNRGRIPGHSPPVTNPAITYDHAPAGHRGTSIPRVPEARQNQPRSLNVPCADPPHRYRIREREHWTVTVSWFNEP